MQSLRLVRMFAVILAVATAMAVQARDARAQFRIEDTLDATPISGQTAVNFRLTRFGDQVLGTFDTSFTLNSTHALLASVIPQINRQTACGRDRQQEIVVQDLQFTPPQALTAATGINLQLRAHVRPCHTVLGVNLYEGDIIVTVPLTLVKSANTVQLRVDEPTVQSGGFYAVGIWQVSDRFISSKVQGVLTPRLRDTTAKLNRWIAGSITSAALRQQIQAYRTQIQDVAIAVNDQNLTVKATITGQVATATLNRLINGQ